MSDLFCYQVVVFIYFIFLGFCHINKEIRHLKSSLHHFLSKVLQRLMSGVASCMSTTTQMTSSSVSPLSFTVMGESPAVCVCAGLQEADFYHSIYLVCAVKEEEEESESSIVIMWGGDICVILNVYCKGNYVKTFLLLW